MGVILGEGFFLEDNDSNARWGGGRDYLHTLYVQLFFHAPPPRGERLLFLLLACADLDRHSLYSVCLRELEKINKKLNKNNIFWLFHLTFSRGGDGIASNTYNFIY